MEHDYYQILRIVPNADASEVKAAYRRRARECHPDRGGTHEEMLLVNEAWQILSNDKSRRNYDAQRANRGDYTTQTTVAQDIKRAQREASNYPRKWADFEVWLDRVTGDFTRATYGSTKNQTLGIELPTVENSVSGVLFMLIGGGLALLFVSPLIAGLFAAGNVKPNKIVILMTYVLPAIGGAWTGTHLHRLIGEFLKSVTNQPNQPNGQRGTSPNVSHVVIDCEKCGQKLRVPEIENETLTVTCPSCRHQFSRRSH